MPTECSKTGFSQDQYLSTRLPSYSNIVLLEEVKEAWAKYWPILENSKILQNYEKEIRERVEKVRWIMGTSNRSLIELTDKNTFLKKETSKVIEFYKKMKNLKFENFPEILSLTEASVELANWNPIPEPNFFYYLKLNLYPSPKYNEHPSHLVGGLQIKKTKLKTFPYHFLYFFPFLTILANSKKKRNTSPKMTTYQ